MKVYKSVGAVVVYNRGRAVVLLVVIVAVIAGAGFAGGFAAADDDSAASAQPVAAPEPARERVSAPTVVDDPAEEPAAAPKPRRGGDKGAYRRGYVAGARDVFGDSGDFRAGGAYMVRLERGSRGAPLRIALHVPVESGRTYFLCEGGTRLCIAGG